MKNNKKNRGHETPSAGGYDRKSAGALWLDVNSRAQVGTIKFPARERSSSGKDRMAKITLLRHFRLED